MRVTSRDAEIFYEVLGDGPPVVLLHPFPVHHMFWLPAADFLTSRYRLIAPDLRGHGGSAPGDGPATMEKHARDVARVLQSAGVDKAAFVGNSIGGYVLFEFWRRYPQRVAALVLANTRATPDTAEGRAARLRSADLAEQQGPQVLFDSMTPKAFGPSIYSTRPDKVDLARKMMRKMSAQSQAAILRGMASRPDSVPTLRTIQVPTLIVAGDEDQLTAMAEIETMHREISGSRLHVVPRAGHYAFFEQPEAAGRVLRNFLDSLNFG